MADAAEQLARLAAAGFEIQTSERFPRSLVISRRNVVALLELAPAGLRIQVTPGWSAPQQTGAAIAVLVEEGGRQIFRVKEHVIEATPERLNDVRVFREELEAILGSAD